MGSEPLHVSSAGHQLQIRLFGHASISVNGEPIKFSRRQTTLAMLALVVLQRGRAVARESLAFTLFPDADESAALGELRRYIYLANKSLPERAHDPWLIADSETIRWNTAGEAFVDVFAFEELSAQAETQAEAIDLYAGDLLENVYEDWIVNERERLRARYLAILGESLDRHRSFREYSAAISCAKRLLAADPWREDVLRSLLAIRYESGDTAGALAAYESFAKRLRDELRVAPMPETLAVRASILRNEAVPGSLHAPPPTDADARRETTALLPFVGRQRELAALRATWSRAARGASALVVLTGEAGAGKTRLTAELAQSVQAEGGRVFIGTTTAPESMPYQAIVEGLRSGLPLLSTRPFSASRRATLARLLPELRESDIAGAMLPEQAAERETARIYDALTVAVRALASPRPLLFVLEDVHWAGAATLEALGAIVRELTRAPILVLATAREEELSADHPLRGLQRSLRAYRNVEEMSLGRLDERDVTELIGRVARLRDRDATSARDLFAHSEGNALFLNEAISGMIERDEALPEAAIGSIASVISSRIARLGEEARAVSEIAAVAGAGCSVALIRDVSNLAAASVARGLDELLDRRIVREAGARASHDYVFTHHLIAKSIYDQIDPTFRAQRHARIARLLEIEHRAMPSTSARDIGRHYESAADFAAAAQWYVVAARAAEAVFAFGDAIELASRALANADTAKLRAAALDVRERARGRRGDRIGQRADIDELEALASHDRQARFDVRLRRVLLARTLGESGEEGRLIDELDAVAAMLDETARAQALVQRATHLGLLSRQTDALAPARAALAMYERSGDLRGQCECLILLVDFAANIGDIVASRAYLEMIRERAASLADRVFEGRALSIAGTAALLRNEFRECIDLTSRALAIEVATSDRESEAFSRGRLAAAYARLNDFTAALREFDLTLESYESIGHKRGLALTYTNRTMLLMRLGAFDDALASIERSDTLLEVVREKRMTICNQVNASFAKLQIGDAAAAKLLAQAALIGAREIAFPVFEAAALANLGNAERALGDLDSAIAHMEAGIAIRRPLQESRDFVDDLADLTLTYVQAGHSDAALATAAELSALASPTFDGAFWPHYIWWALARAYGSGAEPARADAAAERARAELAQFAACIEDLRTRAAFLAIAVNAAIAAPTPKRKSSARST